MVKTKKENLTIKAYDIKGEEKKTLAVPSLIFDKEASESLIAQSVRVYLTNQRTGNASTKTRSEVKGSTRKIYRQKGTGRARHGSSKAPIFVGGGVAGGPRPKEYSLSLNSNMRKLALFGSLTKKLKDGGIVGLDEEGLDKVNKTKQSAQFINKLGLEGKKVLFVLPKIEKSNFLNSIRNIKNAEFIDSASLNTYSVLRSKMVVFTKSSIESLEKHYLKS